MYKLEKVTEKGEAVGEKREQKKVNNFFQEGHRMLVKIIKSDEALGAQRTSQFT